ncbi:MAG: hypothetical protein GY756_23515 [bacterium]|nr:hypothetical protein [bacterium]
MTQYEFNNYKQRILTKGSGANIHRLYNLLGAMQTCINEIKTPEGEELIMQAKQKIYQTIKPNQQTMHCY